MARTNIRILTLDDEFFEDYRDIIELLDLALGEAEAFVEEYGCPLCDFKKFQQSDSIKKKLLRAKTKAKIMKDVIEKKNMDEQEAIFE